MAGVAEDSWGDLLGKKHSDSFRVVQLNIATMAERGNSAEFRANLAQFTDLEADCITLQELNRVWHRLPERDRLFERFRGAFEAIHICEGRYKNDSFASGSLQYGGTAVLSLDSTAHQIHSSQGRSYDSTGLARWVATRLAGKNGVAVRVVSVYRPNPNDTGALSVFMQHLAGLAELNDDRTPLQAFGEDLRAAIEEWRTEGDSIIIGMDLNGDVCDVATKRFFNELDLREVITERHGSSAPETYADGSRPVDGIFASRNLDVLACGYLPFGAISDTDHRCLWVDIPRCQLFGEWTPSRKVSDCRLVDGHPRIEAKFIKALEDHLRRHRALQRARAVTDAARFPSLPDQDLQWEKLDRIMVEGRRHAARKCRRLRTGRKEWTPELSILRTKVALCRSMVKRRQFRRISSKLIRRQCKAIGDFSIYQKSLPEIRAIERATMKELDELDNVEGRRSKYLERLAVAEAAAGRITAAGALRRRNHREQQRSLGRRLARFTGKHKRQSNTVLRVRQHDATGQELPPRVLDAKPDQEEAVLSEYEKRLRLTQGRGMMTGEMLVDFGYLGVGPAVQDVLDGVYEPPLGTDVYTSLWFKQLAYKDPVQLEWEPDFSFDEFKTGWKKVRPRTSPGYSRLNALQFKVGLKNPYISQFDYAMARYPFRSGYSPQRWRIGLDAVIPKKIGNNFIEDSRTILLFELDSNLNNKILAKKMMSSAEERGSLAFEQYGSRRNLSSAEQSLNKVLVCDLFRLERCSAAICAEDLRSCYDLIAHAPATLSMRSQGAPAPPIHSMFSSLQNMVHHCQTSFGVSEATFGGDVCLSPDQPPPQGAGQGNGAGPAIWAVVSTPFFDILRQQGHGAHFVTAISEENIHLAGSAFVDDADLLSKLEDGTARLVEITADAQRGFDLFAGCVRATGGQIRPDKCWWYPIAFRWNQGCWSYQCDTLDQELTVDDGSGRRHVIKRLSPEEAQEMLGVWIAPDGNCRRAVAEMTAQAQTWAEQVRTGFIRREDAYLSLQMTVMKKLEYPLTALSLTEAECKRIEAPIRKQGMPECGIKRSLPHVVVDGPPRSHGLGYKRLFYRWGEKHVEVIMKHGHLPSVTGDLLRACVQRHHLESGSGKPIFETSYQHRGDYSTKTWARQTWKFLSDFDIRIEADQKVPTLQREDDVFLMEAFIAAGLPTSILRKANRCRLFLKAMTLADIASGDGRTVRHEMWKGRQDDHLNYRRYQWTYQGKPSSADWLAWRTALGASVVQPGQWPGDTDPPLRQRLGRWLEPPSSCWRWFLSRSSGKLYERVASTWQEWDAPVRSPRSSRIRWTRAGPVASPPADIARTLVFQRGMDPGIWSTGSITMVPAPTVPEPTNLVDRLQEGDPSRTWATRDCVVDDNGNAFAEALRRGDAVAVSDGSFKGTFGTSASVLQGADGSGRMVVMAVAPGAPDCQSAYRSELSGIYSSLCVVEQTCLEHDICEGYVTIGCDGEEALWQAVQSDDPVDTSFSDFDLVSAIRTKITSLPVGVGAHWVKGHQDTLLDHQLDGWARLNIWCDALAKHHWARCASTVDEIQWTIEGEMPRLWLGDYKVSKDLRAHLYDWCEGSRARDYWLTKRDIPAVCAPFVDWDAVEIATRSLRGLSSVLWKAKHLSRRLPWGVNMKRWGLWPEATCPMCKQDDEDATHLFQCTKVARVQFVRMKIR